MDFYIIAGILFILSILGARMVNEKGLKLLTTEQKGLLVQAFSDLYKIQLIFLALIIGLYIFLIKYFPGNLQVIMIGYFALLIFFMFFQGFSISRKLDSYGLPKGYSRYYILSTFIKTGGMVAALAILFYTSRK